MNPIIKILKALNSNQEPWQISLAVIFGMVVGLLPFFNLTTLFFIFLVFIINVNIGIFILSASFFAVLGFILDPLLSKIGYLVLTLDPLIPLWTALYNIPYMKWTAFNNTVTMGALIVSLILAFPMFFILNKLIEKYREKIAWIFNKFPILKSLKIFTIYEKTVGKDWWKFLGYLD